MSMPALFLFLFQGEIPEPPTEPEVKWPFYEWLKEKLWWLTGWMPQEVQGVAPPWVWWFVYVIILLSILLIVGLIIQRRRRLARIAQERDWDQGFRENLEECPMPKQPAGEMGLSVYHIPVCVRLVVVAPMGHEIVIQQTDLPRLLNMVFPDLGTVVARDDPRIRIWEPQLSDLGFVSAFHRRTIKPEPDGEPSRWILLVGKAFVGKHIVLLGLGLWSEQPNSIGRLNMTPMRWMEILRLRGPGNVPTA